MNAQELMCRVSVNYSQVKTTNVKIFQSLQRDISEFMNTTHWTNYIFSNQERIDCSMLINISQYNGVDEFTATLQVSSSRPIFDASITSQVINIKEHNGWFKFKYLENQPIEFNENSFTSDLASTLAFYAYFVIGMDFDTFSEFGGNPFFEKAQKVVTNAQSSQYKDPWKPLGTSKEDNRYYLIKNINSPVFKNYRKAMYTYHRLGLDKMTTDITNGRQNIVQSIGLIKQIYQKKPNNYIVNIFLDSKRKEIINIFSEAPPQESNRVKQVLQLIDPAHTDDYSKMGRNQ